MNVRDTDDLDVDRSFASTSEPTGSPVRAYRRVETLAEVRVRLERQLAATVGASDPWPLDGDASAAERHLPRRMAMADGSAAGIVLALRPDDLIDFLFHQLGEHAQPDTDAQREQALLRSADQLPERLLHARRQHELIRARLRERYVPIHGGSLL